MITAQAIYNQLVEDVRKKSKEKVYPPISFRKLIDKKGIDISSIKNQIDSKIIKQNEIHLKRSKYRILFIKSLLSVQ